MRWRNASCRRGSIPNMRSSWRRGRSTVKVSSTRDHRNSDRRYVLTSARLKCSNITRVSAQASVGGRQVDRTSRRWQRRRPSYIQPQDCILPPGELHDGNMQVHSLPPFVRIEMRVAAEASNCLMSHKLSAKGNDSNLRKAVRLRSPRAAQCSVE